MSNITDLFKKYAQAPFDVYKRPPGVAAGGMPASGFRPQIGAQSTPQAPPIGQTSPGLSGILGKAFGAGVRGGLSGVIASGLTNSTAGRFGAGTLGSIGGSMVGKAVVPKGPPPLDSSVPAFMRNQAKAESDQTPTISTINTGSVGRPQASAANAPSLLPPPQPRNDPASTRHSLGDEDALQGATPFNGPSPTTAPQQPISNSPNPSVGPGQVVQHQPQMSGDGLQEWKPGTGIFVNPNDRAALPYDPNSHMVRKALHVPFDPDAQMGARPVHQKVSDDKTAGRGHYFKKWIERTPVNSMLRTVGGDSAITSPGTNPAMRNHRADIAKMFKKYTRPAVKTDV